MSFGPVRYLYDNFLDDATITAASQAAGSISLAEQISGSGEASMYAAGSFTGSADLSYSVQIDSVVPGNEVGQSTYRWKTSASTGWEATGVTTSSALATLNNGVSVAFVSADGDDFQLSDTYYFFTVARFGTDHLCDRNRNSVFRSGATFTLTFDLGSARNVKVCAIFDHNLTAATSTLTLQGNNTNVWTAPAYSQALTIADPLIFYLDATYRYWRLVPVDSTLSYVQIGELFMGDYLELDGNAEWGSVRTFGYTGFSNRSRPGILRQHIDATQRRYALKYETITPEEVDDLLTMRDALIDPDGTGKVSGVIVHLFSDEADSVMIADWTNMNEFSEEFKWASYSGVPDLMFEEQVKTRI